MANDWIKNIEDWPACLSPNKYWNNEIIGQLILLFYMILFT